MEHKLITFLADSNPNNGAVNINNIGSQFAINLQTPLSIPKNAKNCNIIVKNAIVWFVTPNITSLNNKFKINYESVDYTISLPIGLYNVNTLSNKILSELTAISGGVVPDDIIQLLEDDAENKVVIQFNYYNTIIDFTISNSFREILGFNSRIITGYTDPPATDPIPFYEEADNVAEFNQTDYYLIKCPNLLTRGLERNGQYAGIMCKIDVDVDINRKITYDPSQIAIIPAPELPGIDLSNLTFQLTNQKDELVDTRGEHWNLTFEIHYDVPYVM